VHVTDNGENPNVLVIRVVEDGDRRVQRTVEASTAGEVHGCSTYQQGSKAVLNQGGSVGQRVEQGATTCSNNGDAAGAGSMSRSDQLAAITR
jgi:hypothetical protein